MTEDSAQPTPALVGDLVRTVRTAAGLTQQELARRAGTTQAMIARYESDAVSPTVRALSRIVAACGQSLVLAASADPAARYVDCEPPRPGISDYLDRPDPGWIPGSGKRRSRRDR